MNISLSLLQDPNENEKQLWYMIKRVYEALNGQLAPIPGGLGVTLGLALVNGANSDIALNVVAGVVVAVITGPTGAFTVTGFSGGQDGMILILINTTAQQMTVVNEATSSATNRIRTLAGADLVLSAGNGNAVVLVYDGKVDSRWKAIASRP